MTAVLPEGLSLELLPSQETAFLPVSHLSDHMELCPLLLDSHRQKLEFATVDNPYIISGLMLVCPKLPSRPVVCVTNTVISSASEQSSFKSLHINEFG